MSSNEHGPLTTCRPQRFSPESVDADTHPLPSCIPNTHLGRAAILCCGRVSFGVVWAAVFTFNPYLLISINELMISIIHLLISINELLISISELLISINDLLISINTSSSTVFIDINNSFIDINKGIIDINNSFIDINKYG